MIKQQVRLLRLIRQSSSCCYSFYAVLEVTPCFVFGKGSMTITRFITILTHCNSVGQEEKCFSLTGIEKNNLTQLTRQLQQPHTLSLFDFLSCHCLITFDQTDRIPLSSFLTVVQNAECTPRILQDLCR